MGEQGIKRTRMRNAYLECDEMLPMLGPNQRGAVMADRAAGEASSGNTGLSYAALRPESCLAAFLFVDRVEYIKLRTQFAFMNSRRLGRDDLSTLRHVFMTRGHCQLEELAISVWDQHEQVEPGKWTMWHDPEFDPVPQRRAKESIGFRLALQNALRIPHPTSELDRVLEFKERHGDELIDLRLALDELCMKVARSRGDLALARLELEKIDHALTAYDQAVRGANFEKVLGNLVVKMDVGAAVKTVAAAVTPTALATHSLLATTAAIGLGALAAVTVERSGGVGRKKGGCAFAYTVWASRKFGTRGYRGLHELDDDELVMVFHIGEFQRHESAALTAELDRRGLREAASWKPSW